MDRFYEWSGLKINLSKTYVTIFGRDHSKPKYINELKLKRCNSFKLLGIHFDSTLSNMQKNYQIDLDNVHKELHSWKHRYLTFLVNLL